MSFVKRKWSVKPRIEGTGELVLLGDSDGTARPHVYIGSLAEDADKRNISIGLALAKEQVVAVCGKRGSGKSFTLGAIAEAFAVRGEGGALGIKPQSRAALLLDPLDIYWTTRLPVTDSPNDAISANYKIARQAGLVGLEFDVDVFLPGRRFQREGDPDWIEPVSVSACDLTENEWEIALGVNMTQEPMGQALFDALQLVRSGYTSATGSDVEGVCSFDLGQLSDAVEARELDGVYHRETSRALRQRIRSLNNLGVISGAGTPLTDLLKPGRLSVLLLNRLPDSLRDILSAILVRRIMDSRSRAAFGEKRLNLDSSLSAEEVESLAKAVSNEVPKTTILLDEAQNFLDPSGRSISKDVFIKLVKEGRNSGISFFLATQQPAAVDKRILSQVETFITHQLVTEADLTSLEANLKSASFETAVRVRQNFTIRGLIRSLSSGECLISAADSTLPNNRTVLVGVRPRATMHGGVEL